LINSFVDVLLCYAPMCQWGAVSSCLHWGEMSCLASGFKCCRQLMRLC